MYLCIDKYRCHVYIYIPAAPDGLQFQQYMKFAQILVISEFERVFQQRTGISTNWCFVKFDTCAKCYECFSICYGSRVLILISQR